MMQPGKEGLVLEGLLDEWIDVLLERQVHSDADALNPFAACASWAPSLAACLRPGSPPATMSHPIALSAEHMCLTSW